MFSISRLKLRDKQYHSIGFYNLTVFKVNCPDFCTHEAKNAEWIESTCNDSGYYREYCEICGETLYYEDMPMREHMPDENGHCMMCDIVMW